MRRSVEMLTEMPEAQIRSADDFTLVSVFLAQKELEQSRLAGAIAPDQTDALTRIVLPGNTRQHIVDPVGLMYFFESIKHLLKPRTQNPEEHRCGEKTSHCDSDMTRLLFWLLGS